MPTIILHPPAPGRSSGCESPLPQLLQTPSGLAIVEIQGTVNSSLSPEQHTADGALPLGKLMFPLYDPRMTKDDTSWHKRVYLYIGKHQRLTGEVKKLLRPIAVLRRKSPAEASEERGTAGSGGSGDDDLEVAEIVYYKLLFAHRPEPVGTSGV
ncbi:hypothetical protein KC354_g14227 [Hortaea werneckii]|nr:hypothetical protein KC354_g14227 [Hortaea werneckii]